MKTKLLLTISLMLISQYSIAGSGVGNGGDVLICTDGKTELLDIYQGRESWNLPIKELQMVDRKKLIYKILNPLKKSLPGLSEKLLRNALRLESEIRKIEYNPSYDSKLVELTRRQLVNIGDEGFSTIPYNCELAQAAIHTAEPFLAEKEYVFQKDIWETLSPQTQVSLIIHETIFANMVAKRLHNSRKARLFNAALHSFQFKNLSDVFQLNRSEEYNRWIFNNVMKSFEGSSFSDVSSIRFQLGKCDIQWESNVFSSDKTYLKDKSGRKTTYKEMSFEFALVNWVAQAVRNKKCE